MRNPLIVLILWIGVVTGAHAQAVSIVVPTNAGSPVDLTARALIIRAHELGNSSPWVVTNGGDKDEVARAKFMQSDPNKTLLITTTNMNPALVANLREIGVVGHETVVLISLNGEPKPTIIMHAFSVGSSLEQTAKLVANQMGLDVARYDSLSTANSMAANKDGWVLLTSGQFSFGMSGGSMALVAVAEPSIAFSHPGRPYKTFAQIMKVVPPVVTVQHKLYAHPSASPELIKIAQTLVSESSAGAVRPDDPRTRGSSLPGG